MDSVAIIAAAARNVDFLLVIALQTARFVVVLTIGPTLAKWIARSIRM